MKTQQLVDYLNSVLKPDKYNDYTPNGLQISGTQDINVVVGGVTACLALIDKAIEMRAGAILVHHGYFWNGEDRKIIGNKRQRIAKLLKHDINLIAYHIPLDKHQQYGNNVLWGKALGLKITAIAEDDLLWFGEFPSPVNSATFGGILTRVLGRKPMRLIGDNRHIRRVAWSSGAAQDLLDKAAQADVDVFLSGEVSERTTHQARELGVEYYCCGHHATEVFGVKALIELIREQFSINAVFVDIPNPI